MSFRWPVLVARAGRPECRAGPGLVRLLGLVIVGRLLGSRYFLVVNTSVAHWSLAAAEALEDVTYVPLSLWAGITVVSLWWLLHRRCVVSLEGETAPSH